LTTLNSYRLCGAERLVQLRFREDAVAADTASEPRAEGFLVGEGAVLHRPKFRCEKLGVAASHTRHNK
jgi:hypothetical protein